MIRSGLAPVARARAGGGDKRDGALANAELGSQRVVGGDAFYSRLLHFLQFQPLFLLEGSEDKCPPQSWDRRNTYGTNS